MKPLAKARPELCEAGILERPRYFPRQLMTPEELILEQNYARDKMRRHNRMLHGWGVVCGAIVCRVTKVKVENKAILSFRGKEAHPCPNDEDENCLDPWHVSVSSGYILGPYGDEILIPCDIVVDVRKACTTGASGDPCPPPPDPWCVEVTVDLQPGPVYLAVRYKEILTRPVRVQPVGCGCNETACEYSRIRDGYEICTLEKCPDSHRGQPQDPNDCKLQPCPQCPEDPWVVLARIDIDSSSIIDIDNYDCRRHVISFANYWCRPDQDPMNWGKPLPYKDIKTPMEESASDRVRKIALEHLNIGKEVLDDEKKMLQIVNRNATDLHDAANIPWVGKRLESEKINIADLAGMSEDDVAEFAGKGVRDEMKSVVMNRTFAVWKRAKEIVDTFEAFQSSYK